MKTTDLICIFLTLAIIVLAFVVQEQTQRITVLRKYAVTEYERGVREMACVNTTNDFVGCLIGTRSDNEDFK